MRPHAAHARKVVVELRQLHLELSLGGHGVLGEDVEDQLRAVDDAHAELVLEPALLARVEVVVDDDRLGLLLLDGRLHLGELALADERARIGRGAMLDDLAHRLDARGAHELGDLVQLVGGIGARRDHDDAEPALGLGSRHEIRLGFRHPTWIMPAPARYAAAVPDLADRLAQTTLALVDIPSESRDEAAAAAWVEAELADAPVSLVHSGGFGAPVRVAAPPGHSARCSSPGTWTRFPRRGTGPAGSRTASCTGSARAT